MLMKSEHRKELVSEIRSLAQSQGLNTVFMSCGTICPRIGWRLLRTP